LHWTPLSLTGPVGFGMVGGDESLDSRVSLSPVNESWRVKVWGKNATDTFYWSNVIKAQETGARYAVMLVTCGITLAIDD
jgi:iron complex outermembrane receptor protein